MSEDSGSGESASPVEGSRQGSETDFTVKLKELQ